MKKLLPLALLTVFTASQVPGEHTATTRNTVAGQRCSTAVWGSRGIEDAVDNAGASTPVNPKATNSTVTSGR